MKIRSIHPRPATGRTLLAAALCAVTWPSLLPAQQATANNPAPQNPAVAVPERYVKAIEAARGSQAGMATTYTEREQAAIELAIAAIPADPPLSRDSIQNLKIRSVDWSDGSLGCPQPGQEYTQQIVPGFFVSFSVEGEIKTVHVGNGRAVECDRFGEIMDERRKRSQAYLQVYQSARIDLARRLYVDPEQVEIVSMKAETWTDSSLGCPVDGEDYEHGAYEGLRIEMKCRDHRYEYRTLLEGDGEFMVCGEVESCHETK